MSLDDADSLEILEGLAAIEDIGDFRLRDFMSALGLNPNQPATFYRQLIKEARENEDFIKCLEETIDKNVELIAKQRAELSSKNEQIKKLEARLRSLQNGTCQKDKSLEKERHDLEVATSELQDKVLKYEAMVELLRGELKDTTLKAVSELFWDMHTDALHAKIEGRPPPDPARLDEIRQMLAEELRDLLRVPSDTLQKLRDENRELRERCEALSGALKLLCGGEGRAG